MPRSPADVRTNRGLMAALVCLTILGSDLPRETRGDDKPSSPETFLAFIRAQADALRRHDKAPATLEEWKTRDKAIRAHLLDAWGGFPAEECGLDPQILGTIERDGYRIEKVVFQTRAGVRMTANAYVPAAAGKHPAILMVHGHWKGAKQDPTVQARCIGAVKLGFFVLVVDAFGAGERGIGKALGEYHGGATGATLLPVGLPLSGLQVYENLRAVDYLRSRPEVDGDQIGITGASGGGNQTMYAGAFDRRLKAVVPVCSVGNYRAYLGAACCMCEVVPGALRFTEESGVLGLTAPRALMVVNATQDAVQFSVAESNKSLAAVEPIYKLWGEPSKVRHTIFESPHDYSRPMREAIYGWMTLHLKAQGDGAPIPEPPIKTEDPETLRCFPGDSRPDDWMTIPRFAALEGRKLVASRAILNDVEDWKTEAVSRRRLLVEKVFGGSPQVGPVDPSFESFGKDKSPGFEAGSLTFTPEPGLTFSSVAGFWDEKSAPLVMTVDLHDPADAETLTFIKDLSLVNRNCSYCFCRLRATPRENAGHPDDGPGLGHNTAEWGLWIGRPMLGQWVFDVRRHLDAIEKVRGLPKEVIVIGKGRGGLVAVCAAAVDPRITKVAVIGSLASYVTEKPYVNQNLGLMAPGILREVGDVAQIAALIAPRRLVIANGVTGSGEHLTSDQLHDAYHEASRAWELLGAGKELTLLGKTDLAEVLKALGR